MTLDIEKIKEAVEAVERLGSQVKAAKELGIARSTLQNRLAKAEGHEFLESEAEEIGFPKDSVKAYWVKSRAGSFYVKCDTNKTHEDIRESFLEFAKSHAPSYEPMSHEPGENLLVINACDVHFGKLSVESETGFTYNIEKANERIRKGVAALAAKAKVHGISKIIFVMGNDVAHVDTPHRTTTSGTPQDTDGMWHQSFLAAKKAYIAVIENLTQIADVHLVHCVSNHDFQTGWMIADSVCSWFYNHPNVYTAEGSVSIAHRKYVQFGNNLLMFTHGDGCKEKDIPNLMQYEARQAWGECKFSYAYLGHFHSKIRNAYGKNSQKIEKDFIGVTVIKSAGNVDPSMNTFVEVVRSPSPPDRWHTTNGYVNEQAVECFIHSPTKGQFARFTEYF